MAKRMQSPLVGAVVHDHFDGSAHCVECNGDCRLTGGNRLATQLVRYWFEQAAMQPVFWIAPCAMDSLGKVGVNVDHFRARAIQSMRGIKQRAK